MVPGLDADRHSELAKPLSGSSKFARSCAHREITGADHCVGPLLRNFFREPIERGTVFLTEVEIADMEQADWLAHF